MTPHPFKYDPRQENVADAEACPNDHADENTKNACIFALQERSGKRRKNEIAYASSLKVILPQDPNSATAATKRSDCNHSAMAGFAAAHG